MGKNTRWNGFGAGWSARGKMERALVVQQRYMTGLWRGTRRLLFWSALALAAGALLSSATRRRSPGPAR